ncbi:purine catabolism regulator [Kribbella aluminosa]|uniref:Purine catabolism regulator n=1 Tax=Kribbella aluminosa TaxID=416017 RepID=A0ABS4UK23_9ACTN|nr:PucR family transcriptional regulator [Kribbella aluminosa]MBP2351995.1 purine catabolism regulator [Kribbella aluminosa]
MPKLADLAKVLGTDLELVNECDLPATELGAVHISELQDPTTYLSGGELLLTTGMPLSGHAGQARAYVARLARHGISGLGFGLGPVHAEVPVAVVRACDAAGLPLFRVPAPTPFLVITRAYWELQLVAGRAELSLALNAHRALIRAAGEPDPARAIVQLLAQSTGGWAAYLDADGTPLEVWPDAARPRAERIRQEIDWLRGAGPHSAATFPLDDEDVVAHPLAGQNKVRGFVATAWPRDARRPDEQVVLAACALLTMRLEQRRESVSRHRTERHCQVLLALAGHTDAAQVLGSEIGSRLPAAVRVIVAGPTTAVSADDLLDRWARQPVVLRSTWLAQQDDCLWILARPDHTTAVLETLRGLELQDVRIVAGPVAALDALPTHRMLLAVALARTAPGEIHDERRGSRATDQIDALLAHSRSDLIGAVVAYLRCAGHWDRAAALLGVHRNTMRQRITNAQRVAGIDLDDADQTSQLWLALRGRGLA